MSYINVFISFFSLSFIIFFHELGHFLFCRYFGVFVEVFSVGFGGNIFSYIDKHKTKWVFGWITVGGYVQPLEKTREEAPELIGIENVHPFKNILIDFAGPLFNFILGFFLILGVSLYKGIPVMRYEISYVKAASTADQNGFQIGDVITDVITEDGGHVVEGIRNARIKDGSVVAFVRKGKELKKKIKLTQQAFDGVGYRYNYKKTTVKNSLWYSFLKVFEMIFMSFLGVCLIFKSLFLRLIGYGSENLYMNVSGALGVVATANNFLKNGFADFLFFLSSVSISLGAFNLFPIPVLDGGQILINFIEWIFGRRFNDTVRYILFVVSFFIMLCLFVFSTLLDLYRAKIIQI
ncbi:M50 family metallopeptidase [Alphaproteobacteria bacterium endosymbiont of Tiliacea citrago]|uniref:M50 family metallopeptidase n=1 Tax=Alphaproteobacteria bacterium endosymbiont of Tiliacea citrago TaxID=3077944 RepID=UPI00313B64AD